MRTLFGIAQDHLLLGVFALLALVVVVLVGVSVRNPLLPRLAWRNVPRRPGFAALITLGLTLGTIILSSAFTTGDTMSQSVRAVVAGALGSADEVVFVPATSQPTGWDLAQSIASGMLLTGVSSPFPQSDVAMVQRVLDDDPRVSAVVPVLLAPLPVASDAGEFRAQINLFGAPGALELAPDEVNLNTEAAAALGVRAGDWLRVFLPNGEARLRVRQVTPLGDLGGGQATAFLPLEHLQELLGLDGQINQVLVLNRGDPSERLRSSWPITVKLRAAFLDDASAERLFRAFSAPPARQSLERAAADPLAPRLGEKVRRLLANLDAAGPSPEFKALAQDPEILNRLASRLPRVVTRSNTPFAATLAGGPAHFRVIDVQSVAQDQADRWGSAFTNVFVVLGSFSLFSGVLLIVLVFSLVALERRGELGVTRALGARRRDVISLLAIEGGLYSLVSSLFGLGGGLAIGLGLIALAQGLVEEYGFHLEPVIEPTSIAASYGLGVVLTFVTVTATAWRSSRFSIVTAIRDLPDPTPGPPGWQPLVAASAPGVLGALLVTLGLNRQSSLAYAASVVLLLIGGALVTRWVLLRSHLGGERLVFTLAGLALVGYWSGPPAFPSAVELPFVSGVAMLLGAVWVIAYNVGLLRLVRGPTPLWKLSTAYVASNRFRTGMTLAMFGLVVLSLTLSAVLLTVTRAAYGDPEALTGGWDIRAQSTQPPRDLRSDLGTSGAVSPDAFAAIGAAAPFRVEIVQTDALVARWQSVNLLAVDEGFTQDAPTSLTASVADQRATWTGLTSRSGTAVVGAGLLTGANGGPRLATREGPGFRPFVLWARDTRSTQPAVRLEVVGLVDARGPFGTSILVGAPTLAGWPASDRAIYYLTAPPGANVRELATGLNLSLPDLTAATIGEELRLVQGVRGLLSWLLQGFMGIGLLAGVAAVGTLSTRAVVERRRQIGILRSLGFSARAVGAGLLVESALLAVLGSCLGVGVGLVVARETVTFLTRQNAELRFGVPWEHIAGIVLLALGAALLMTVLPARAAARLTPAEALRES